MPSPFYPAIKGTTAGTPGTGAFTPNAAASMFRAWSTVPAGWCGLVRYEDGTSWELEFSYWNGTTLSRASTQLLDSSSGSQISLTSSATAALVVSGLDIQPDLGLGMVRGYTGVSNVTTVPTAVGLGAITVTGTATTWNPATTNALTELGGSESVSATTINAQAGYSSGSNVVNNSSSGRGGFVFSSVWGAAGLPTGPRLFVGLSNTTFVGQTIEPSAFTAHVAAFALDSTDTNIQLITNSNVSGCTKIDTGIPLVANGVYESTIWCDPGSSKIWALLIRKDTGAIFLTSTTTDVPGTVVLRMHCLGGLNGTNTGTAFSLVMASMFVRQGQ